MTQTSLERAYPKAATRLRSARLAKQTAAVFIWEWNRLANSQGTIEWAFASSAQRGRAAKNSLLSQREHH
jgi:hypothetical protein